MTASRALVALAAITAAYAQCPRITSPPPDAHPDSAYVALEGSTAADSELTIHDNDAVLTKLPAPDGRFERVLHLAAGSHTLTVETAGCQPARVSFTIAAYRAPPASAAVFELMRAADVILAHNRGSRQDRLWEPTYTHSALYLGAAPNGAARIVEAVSNEDATSRGPVAAVPIEDSLAFRFGDRIDIFRAQPRLSADDRSRVLSWARRIAAQGLPFWNDQDFGDYYRAWLLWDAESRKPRDPQAFAELLQSIHQRLEATTAFDCATLVWHAYRDNTAAHIDLASPNRAQFGAAAKAAPAGLEDALRSVVIVPDAFALSGKLEQVRPQ